MSFLKELFNSIARTLGRIIAYALIGFLIFFVFGKLTNAQSITTSDYHIAGINTSWGVDGNEYHTSSYGREYGLMGFQFIPYDNSQYFQLTKTSYSISYTASVKVNPDYVLKGSFTMLVNNNGTFQNATCDYNEQYDIEVVSSSNNTATYNISYSCGELISNGTYNGIMFRFITTNQQPVFYIIRLNDVIITDLKDIGAGDSAIIQNNNQNTDKITQNQDKNTQEITDKQEQTNEKLDDINDSLTDSSVPSTDNIPTFEFNNGPISGLLTMPITWFNAFVNPGTCNDISLGSLLGTELKFACINPEDYLGSSIWSTIDIFIVVMMIISISSMVLHIVDSFRNLNDMFDEYYTPKHQGYKTKHNGERI